MTHDCGTEASTSSSVNTYTASGPASMRAHIEPHRAWLEEVLGCELGEMAILEINLPLEPLFLAALLPGVPIQMSQGAASLSDGAPRVSRWALPPQFAPRIALDPKMQVDRSTWTLRWLPAWQETPVALWLEESAHAIVVVRVPFVAHRHGTSDSWTTWVLTRRTCAADTLDRLGACLRDPRKRMRVVGGRDTYLPANSYRWDRVVLHPETGRLVRDDFESFLAHREWFVERDLPFRRGYLFYGPPGNGKTSAIRVMAAHPLITPVTLDLGHEDTDNQSLTEAFETAADHTPALVIFEDLDRMFAPDAPEEQRRKVTLQHLLNCLDGVGSHDGIIVVATANEPANLDPAILRRPGRFDRVVEFRNPDGETRRAYFARQMGPGADEEALSLAAQQSAGLSFAQLREAYVLAGQAAFATTAGRIGRPELLDGIAQMRRSARGLSQYRLRRPVGFEGAEP